MPVIRLSERQWLRYHRGLAGEVTRRLAERRERLIIEHMDLVKRIARRVLERYITAGQGGYAAGLQLDDFVSSGHIGLVQAADRYRSEEGPFPKFAYLRIRGAILDAHKRRAYREEIHESIEQWQEEAYGEEGHSHSVTIRALEKLMRLQDTAPLPDAQAEASERLERLRRAVAALPPDERQIIQRALRGELTGQIAAHYGHAPNWARVRLHSAREKLAAQLKEVA